MFVLSAEEEKALEEMYDEEYQLRSFNEWVEMMEHEYGDKENPLV